jgi:hypothetical protein
MRAITNHFMHLNSSNQQSVQVHLIVKLKEIMILIIIATMSHLATQRRNLPNSTLLTTAKSIKSTLKELLFESQGIEINESIHLTAKTEIN